MPIIDWYDQTATVYRRYTETDSYGGLSTLSREALASYSCRLERAGVGPGGSGRIFIRPGGAQVEATHLLLGDIPSNALPDVQEGDILVIGNQDYEAMLVTPVGRRRGSHIWDRTHDHVEIDLYQVAAKT